MNHTQKRNAPSVPTYSELMHNAVLFAVSPDKRVQSFVYRNREFVATQTPRGWIVQEVVKNSQTARTVARSFNSMAVAR